MAIVIGIGLNINATLNPSEDLRQGATTAEAGR